MLNIELIMNLGHLLKFLQILIMVLNIQYQFDTLAVETISPQKKQAKISALF